MKKDKKNKKEITEQPALSDEQLQLLNSHMKEHGKEQISDEPFDKSAKAQAIRYAKKHKASATVIIIAAVSLLLVISLLIAYAISEGSSSPNKKDFTVRIGENKYTATYEDIVITDIMYIDMTKISLIDDIQISGDSHSRKYTLPNLQYLRFENESSVAIIDGEYFNMNQKALIDGNMCLVPLEFISKVFVSGLTFSVDTEKNEIKIERIQTGVDGNNVPVYEPLAVSNEIKSDLSNIGYEAFGINAIEHIQYIDPKTNDYLILANHEHPLSKDYIPSDLVQLTCDTNPVNPPSYYSLRKATEKALSLMMTAMKNSGIVGIQASSAYRSYDRQEYLLNYYISSKVSSDKLSYESARVEVLKTLALPGHSEHQTGLAVDFVQGTSSLTTDFENTTAFSWLSENAHKFGFILRYPSDKVNVTGYDYEPWHYRFVGRTVASRIYEAKICFEEYIALTK